MYLDHILKDIRNLPPAKMLIVKNLYFNYVKNKNDKSRHLPCIQ